MNACFDTDGSLHPKDDGRHAAAPRRSLGQLDWWIQAQLGSFGGDRSFGPQPRLPTNRDSAVDAPCDLEHGEPRKLNPQRPHGEGSETTSVHL